MNPRGTRLTSCSQRMPQTGTFNGKHGHSLVEPGVPVSFHSLSAWVNSRNSCLSHCLSSSLVLCVWLSHSAGCPAVLEDSDSPWDGNSNFQDLPGWFLSGYHLKTCFADKVQPCSPLCSRLFVPFPPCFLPALLLAVFLLSVCPVDDAPDHLFPAVNSAL